MKTLKLENQLKLDVIVRCRTNVYQAFMDLVYTTGFDDIKSDLNNVFIALGEKMAELQVQG